MGLLIRVIVAAIVAIVCYVVLTTLLSFPSSSLLFGLLCVVIFLAITFGPVGPGVAARGRWW